MRAILILVSLCLTMQVAEARSRDIHLKIINSTLSKLRLMVLRHKDTELWCKNHNTSPCMPIRPGIYPVAIHGHAGRFHFKLNIAFRVESMSAASPQTCDLRNGGHWGLQLSTTQGNLKCNLLWTNYSHATLIIR